MKLEFPSFFSGFKLTERNALLTCFSIGFFVRLVPELLAFPLPIGFDTIHYAVVMKSGVVWANWSSVFTSSWLLYALIVPLYSVLKADPFLLLKIVAPLLFGLNVAGVYWFSRKALGWSWRLSVVAGVFFALQFAALRISWDLLRNTLGLGILLFALSYCKEVGSRRGFVLFAVLSLFSVFAHEYAAVTLVAVVFGLVVSGLIRKDVSLDSKRLVLAAVPGLVVFGLGLGLRFFPVRFETSANVIDAGDTVSATAGGLFFVVNYLRVQSSVDSYGSYLNLVLNVLVLFAVLYLPYLFLVVKGFFRNGVLDVWTGLLLVGAFGCLLVPFFALQNWHRWMFMLAYPFTFYAVSGLARLLSKVREKRIGISEFFSNKLSVAMLILTFGLGAAYLATPVFMVYAETSVPTITSTYLYFSTAPTVPYQDVNNVVESMEWLNANMGTTSCVVLHDAFLNWGKLYLSKSHEIVYFVNSHDAAVAAAFNNGFNRLYFVWWNEPIGWYGVSVSSSFVSVQDFGRISVYAYEGENVGP